MVLTMGFQPGIKTITVPLFALVVCGLLPAVCRAQDSRSHGSAPAVSSLYTDISAGNCKHQSGETETGGSVQECPGPAGYKLIIEDDDSRMSATVVTPNGEKHPLNYWHVVTQHFSSLGSKAEWRVARRERKTVPIALIIRVNANEDPETSKVTSYLAVAKITAHEICVTDKIKPGAAANHEARSAADASASKPCLQ